MIAIKAIPCSVGFDEAGLDEVFGFFVAATKSFCDSVEDREFSGHFSLEVPGVFTLDEAHAVAGLYGMADSRCDGEHQPLGMILA